MSQYYVRKSGNDSNDGLSPATAWLTIGKALGASGISSGDTVYIGSGVYREKVNCNLVSPTAETFVIGDMLGEHTGDVPGQIRLTNYLTNDKTAPTDQALLELNGRDYLTFQNIMFHIYSNSEIYPIDTGITLSAYIKFIECTFFGQNVANLDAPFLYVIGATDTPVHWLISRCYFFAPGYRAVSLDYSGLTHTADFDADFQILNCVSVFSTSLFHINAGSFGSPRYQACGEIVRGCSIFTNSFAMYYTVAASTRVPSIPARFEGNFVITHDFSAPSLQADGTGQIIAEKNLIVSGYPYLNVTEGAGSVSNGSYAVLFDTGQETLLGLNPKPIFTPSDSSPLLGFGTVFGGPTVDVLNRPRPAGGQSTLNAVGAYERHDTGIEDTSVYDSAPSSVKIIGPGDHDFELPVNPVATNITIMVQYDANHGETNKPQVQLLANPLIGVSAETKTLTEVADIWEKIEFTQFTPTGYGVVTLRCISRAAAGNGQAWFDSITV